MIWIILSLIVIYLALPEISQKTNVGFLVRNKVFQSAVESSRGIRGQVIRFWKGLGSSVRSSTKSIRFAQIGEVLKANRKFAVAISGTLVAAAGWVGVQALLVQNSTPESFAKEFFAAIDAGDYSVLNDSRFYEFASNEYPVIPEGIQFKVSKPKASDLGEPVYYVEEQGEWRFNFEREKSTATGYPIIPVDRWNGIFLERDWQVLNLRQQSISLVDAFASFDPNQTVKAGNLTASVDEIRSKKAPFSVFRALPGEFEVSVTPSGLNLGLEKGVVVVSRFGSEVAPKFTPKPNQLEPSQISAAKKIAEAFLEDCLKKAASDDGCPLTSKSSSDDILSSISNDSSAYDIDWEVYDELSSKWESKGCKPGALQVVSATQANQQFACSGVNTVATRMSGNNCYRKYSTWLGIYIDGCWGTKTIVETEREGFRSTITVPVTLDLTTRSLTYGIATGVAAPPKCKPDSYLCG